VEDFSDAREAIKLALQRDGALVIEASNAAEAFAVVQSQAPPDAIVCDIGLPDEDGISLVKRIRALPGALGRIPVAALTAWGLEEDRAKAADAGFNAYVVKPTDPSNLAGVIDRMREAAKR
jgi:CheY-like chemotaxis protein